MQSSSLLVCSLLLYNIQQNTSLHNPDLLSPAMRVKGLNQPFTMEPVSFARKTRGKAGPRQLHIDWVWPLLGCLGLTSDLHNFVLLRAAVYSLNWLSLKYESLRNIKYLDSGPSTRRVIYTLDCQRTLEVLILDTFVLIRHKKGAKKSLIIAVRSIRTNCDICFLCLARVGAAASGVCRGQAGPRQTPVTLDLHHEPGRGFQWGVMPRVL